MSATSPAIPAAFAAISATAQLGGAISQAAAIRTETELRERTAGLNRRLLELQAEDVRRRGETEAELVRKRAKQLSGKQRIALAAQGIDIETGTALAAQEDVAALTALDVSTIRSNAWREAWGLRTEALGLESAQRFAAISGRLRERTTLLTGGLRALTELGGAVEAFGERRTRRRGRRRVS